MIDCDIAERDEGISGKTKTMPQNRKKSDGADNDEKEIVPNSTNAIMFDEDMIVCDILSRIPAKSLMRFKCVSKPWCSLIKDPYFVDLHFTKSKTLLRHSSWRKIEAAPPHHFYRTVSSVYVNGSIYWFPNMFFEGDNRNSGDDVVAFDVGSEKFRTIQISKPSDPFLHRCHLLEVTGCVAILRRNTADTADLWVYEDSDKESTYKATTTDSTDKNWTKHTITLPVHWVEERDMYFHTAGGADQIILETHLMNSDGRSKAVSVYSYDLKKKFFEEIKISGIPLSVPVCFDTRMCISFCENLLSLSEA
ncbi:hypothetical protein MKW92_020679 [Papaver armeniacum]|nr:hypothetical protein MKW92_020679 [Papaver armeniacum]